MFRLNDNRQSEVVNPAGDTEEAILEAAVNCPVKLIRSRYAGASDVIERTD